MPVERRDCHEPRANLDYTGSSRPVWVTQQNLVQTNKQTKKNSTQEAETDGSRTLTARAGYTEKPCLEKLKTKKQKQKQASKHQQKTTDRGGCCNKKVPTVPRLYDRKILKFHLNLTVKKHSDIHLLLPCCYNQPGFFR